MIFDDCGYLGRFQLGHRLPLFLKTIDGNSEAQHPDVAPYADIYLSNVLVETIRMPIRQRGQQTGLFHTKLFLGQRYATGSGYVVYRYSLGNIRFQKFAYFNIQPGGDSEGGAMGLREYLKPEAQYIVQHRDANELSFGRNPEV